MFLLYTPALMILSMGFLVQLLDALKYRRFWRFALCFFIAAVGLQLFISSLEAEAVRAFLDSWHIGPLEKRLAFLEFLLFVVPLMLSLDLATLGHIHPLRASMAGFGFGLALAAEIVQPDYWIGLPDSPVSAAGYAFFCIGLIAYVWGLVASLSRVLEKGNAQRWLAPIIMLLMLRFIYETFLDVFRVSLPPIFRNAHAPAFALVLGSYLTALFLVSHIRAFSDKRPVDPDHSSYQHFGLSPREQEVTDCICSGMSTEECALKLGISEKTVNSHLTNVFRKFKVKSRSQLLARLRQLSPK